MSDIVTCKAILHRDTNGIGTLWLASPPDWGLYTIPVRPKGTPKADPQRAGWEYEIKDGRLHLQPSLLCLDTKFHTAYNWECDFVEANSESQFDRFYLENPTITRGT